MTARPASPSGQAEFLILSDRLGIDPGVMVHPRTELSFALARRRCGNCTAEEKCRTALCQPEVALSAVAPFCPNVDLLVELLCRQPGAPA